jgi:hypothetical protein
MLSKAAWTVLASALTFAAFAPYVLGILRGGVRPHVFSWVIWGLTTAVVFFAQWQAGGGTGAWATALSAAITFYIAWLALRRRGDRSITRSDWAFFAGALAALPLWAVTRDPTAAVVVLTAVDLLGFAPTVRVAWRDPWRESALFYAAFALRNAVAVPALETYSLATLLFPVAVGLACAVVVALLLFRRRERPCPSA